MALAGVLFTADGRPKASWFWPDGERVCPFDVPPLPHRLDPGDRLVLLIDVDEADSLRLRAALESDNPSGKVAAFFRPSQREEIIVPSLPESAPGFRRVYQPGYRRIAHAPVAGGRVALRRLPGPGPEHEAKLHTSYRDHAVLFVLPGGERDKHGPPDVPNET